MNLHLERQLEKFRKRHAQSESVLAKIREEKEALGRATTTSSKPKASLAKVKSEKQVEDRTKISSYGRKPRATPIGMQIKIVLELLFKKQTAMPIKEVGEGINHDIWTDEELFAALKNNPKIAYDDIAETFCYQAKFNARDKEELYDNVILKSPDGLPCDELSDVYHGIEKDIQELRKEGKCYLITNTQTKLTYVYPSDKHLRELKVDQKIKDMWAEVQVPEDPGDLDAALQRVGLKPSPRPPAYKRPSKPKADRKRKNPSWSNRQLTNSHLVGTEIFGPVQ